MEKIDNRRKYTLDLNSFIIDSHEKYYWLGMLATDGNIGKSEARIRLELKDTDIDVIKKLASFCKTNSPLKYRTNNMGTKCVRIDINSSKLKKYLSEYNIVPNKTEIFEIPLNKIPKEFLWDFVRGMMDGDGSIIFQTTRKYNPYGISFISKNRKCIEQMKEIWQLPESWAITYSDNAYKISKYGKGCLSILDKIYENSNNQSRMDRKYERYQTLKLSN